MEEEKEKRKKDEDDEFFIDDIVMDWLVKSNNVLLDCKTINDYEIISLLFSRNEDLKLFQSIDNFLDIVIKLIKKIYKTKPIDDAVFLYCILCYIICIKFYSDSSLNKPIDFIKIILRDKYSRRQIIRTEIEILKTLDYQFEL